jgi:hypothetical protein
LPAVREQGFGLHLLPYPPLHHLVFDLEDLPPLMTLDFLLLDSGKVPIPIFSRSPIADNASAVAEPAKATRSPDSALFPVAYPLPGSTCNEAGWVEDRCWRSEPASALLCAVAIRQAQRNHLLAIVVMGIVVRQSTSTESFLDRRKIQNFQYSYGSEQHRKQSYSSTKCKNTHAYSSNCKNSQRNI